MLTIPPLQFVHNVGDDVSLGQDVTSVNGGEELGGSVARLQLRLLLTIQLRL